MKRSVMSEHAPFSRSRRSITELIAAGSLDAELAALLWLLADGGVPLVVTTESDPSYADELRSAVASLVRSDGRTADGGLPGGVTRGSSLEDVLRLGGIALGDGVPDEARDIGAVAVLGEAEHPADTPAATPGPRVLRAHYVRPVERDGAGHLQRRPPALLSAVDGRTSRLDHFFWAINDELATRVGMDAADFERAHALRARLLHELTAAQVFDTEHLIQHLAAGQLQPNAAN
jgi:hypothetical protein